MMRVDKALLSRAWYIAQIGYSQIGWLVALVGYTSIIGYVLVRFIPNWLVYLIVPIFVGLASLLIGLLVIRKGIFQHQNEINAEQQPYIHRVLGYKEYLGYEMSLKSMELLEETTKLDIKWFESMKYDTTALKERLKVYLAYKKQISELLKNAKIK